MSGKTSHQVSIDYSAVFVTDVLGSQREIVMADANRYSGTSSTLVLNEVGGKLEADLSGTFQERPIATDVSQKRTDVYVNGENRRALLKWMNAKFSPSLIARQSVPRGPDPRPFIGGSTAIPLAGVPSSEFMTEAGLVEIPRWKLEGRRVRTFVDVERDPAHGIQYHIGVRFGQKNSVQAVTKILSLYSTKGEFTFDTRAIQALYSYIYHWP